MLDGDVRLVDRFCKTFIIHSCSVTALVRVELDPEPLLGALGMSLGDALNGTLVNHRLPCTHALFPVGQFSITSPPTSMVLGGGRKLVNSKETYMDNM